MALFLLNIIGEKNLGLTVVGWSLGTTFMNMLMECITRPEDGQQKALRQHICSLVLWDPPSLIHGFDDPPTGGWTPLYDESIPPEKRGSAFNAWICLYFPHPNLQSRDPKTLIYKLTEINPPLKAPTFTGISLDEIMTMIDPTAGVRRDDMIGQPEFKELVKGRVEKARFNPETRDAWGNPQVYCIYGDGPSWNIQWAVWCFEDRVKAANNEKITMTFKVMKGANHMVMYNFPELFVDTIAGCIPS